MRFISASITDFRNISSASISLDAKDILLIGENGQGKTNFLEAIYMLCYGSSFRTSHIKEAVNQDKEGFVLSAFTEDEKGIKENLKVSFFENKRRIEIDGKEITDRRSLIYRYPCIAFSHDDISFVKGEPENRRRFFDQMMSLYSPLFFDSLRSYRAVLVQRNAAIKKNPELVSFYDRRLAISGLEMMKERAEAVYGFNSIFPDLFRKVSSSDLDITVRYQPSWSGMDSVEEVERYLASNIERDITLSTTSSGAHRDRFTVMCGSTPFATVGSTGQIRLASILFRIAEAIYFTAKTGIKPILLIDDVLLELDDKKRSALLDNLPGYSQAFYTFLPRESYFGRELGDALLYKAEKGGFTLDRS